jgi:menaquinone-specific isochorismate synthase
MLGQLDEHYADNVHAFVLQASARVQPGAIGIISIPVVYAPLGAFLDVLPRHMSLIWHPTASGVACAGAGVAWRVDLEGVNRLPQLRAECDKLWPRIVVHDHPGISSLPPRIYGGVSFTPGSCGQVPWEEFSDGCFTLPRWLYVRREEGESYLSIAVRADEMAGIGWHHNLLSELDEVLESMHAFENDPTGLTGLRTPEVARPPPSKLHQLSPEAWERHILKIKAAITEGKFQKVVAARRSEVTLPAPVSDIDALAKLTEEKDCTRFAFRRTNGTFLGASPEVLFIKAGVELATEALAGTIRSMGSEFPRKSMQSIRLLGSSKDMLEHSIVVDHIVAVLQPLCVEVDTPNKPNVKKVRTIIHLDTPITATLREGVTAVDLLAALHPTPAVGGLPVAEAAAWIAANEEAARGWYTGAVGWIDIAGDSSFGVAIRCGVVKHQLAYIFTGAGIVADSDPAAEYAETTLKQRPLLNALGVSLA